MIWLTWRQFRAEAAVALGALAAVAIALAITGPHIVHIYDTAVVACRASRGCSAAQSAFLRYDPLLHGGLNLLVIFAPGLIGMFWGAPPVARETETGTFRLARTEGVTRKHWLAAKLGGVGLASMAAAGLLSLMATWWASPIDRVNANRLSPGVFAARDTVPVSYAFAVGVTAGLIIRRTVPALAATLAAFFGARLAMTYWVRPHFATPLTLARNYWPFQWYETAIFLGAALILGGFCIWWVRRSS